MLKNRATLILTPMKNVTTVLADAPTTTLKIAYSYLVQPTETSPQLLTNNLAARSKISPYKSLFVVDPSISTPAVWDVDWYNNYE